MSIPLIIVIGVPGSGKGTQVQLLVQKYGLTRIATGDLVRRAMKEDSPLGVEMRERYDRGVPQPDEVIIQIMRRRLAQLDYSAGLLLDDFPLSGGQAIEVGNLEKNFGLADAKIFLLDIPDEEVQRRLQHRRMCSACHQPALPDQSAEDTACTRCGGQLIVRSDDKPEVIAVRIAEYRQRAKAILEVFQHSHPRPFNKINGQQSVEKVQEDIVEKLGEWNSR